MGKLNDSNVPAAFQPYLEPGEQLRHWAYGVKQPNILLMIPLFVLGVLPGVIATQMLTKNYIVALTDRRFIALQIASMGNLNVKEIMEYRLNNMPMVEASTGPLFTHIKINDQQRPFVAKFHRMGMPNNRLHTQAMEAYFKSGYARGIA
jgi:hypothetical protein